MSGILSRLNHRIEELSAPRSTHWRAVRDRHLLIEPFCKWCGSQKNLQVHHIEPFHLDPDKELDPRNLITLCETFGVECHLRHGHLGDWKKFNPDIRQQANCIHANRGLGRPGQLGFRFSDSMFPGFSGSAITRDLPKAEIVQRGLEIKWWAEFQQDLVCRSAIAGEIIIPRGFITDGASIPKLLWAFLDSVHPDILYPSYAHDLLYSLSGKLPGVTLTRDDCDHVIREQMLVIGAPAWKANAVYAALKVGGAAAWKSDANKALKLANSKLRLTA